VFSYTRLLLFKHAHLLLSRTKGNHFAVTQRKQVNGTAERRAELLQQAPLLSSISFAELSLTGHSVLRLAARPLHNYSSQETDSSGFELSVPPLRCGQLARYLKARSRKR